VTEDRVKVRGLYGSSTSGKRLLIIIHGYGFSHREMIKRGDGIFPEIADVFFLDLRNHGLSDKASTTFGYHEALDVQAAVRYFRSRYKQIIIWGMSMGAAAAVRAAILGNPADMIILEGLYEDLSGAIAHQAKKYYIPRFPIVSLGLMLYEPLSGVILKDMDMHSNLTRLKELPILLVHSRLDQEVPMYSFNRLRGGLGPNGKILILNRGGHESIYEGNALKYRERVIDFILKQSKKPILNEYPRSEP